MRDGRAGVRTQEIAALRARLQGDEATFAKATLDLSRTQALVQSGATPQAELDNAQFAMRRALAERDFRRAALEELVRGTTVDVKAFEGQLRVAQVRELEQRERLARRDLRRQAPRYTSAQHAEVPF